MARKNTAFIGTYAPEAVKEYLKRRAKKKYQTISELLLEIINKEIQNEQREQLARHDAKAV